MQEKDTVQLIVIVIEFGMNSSSFTQDALAELSAVPLFLCTDLEVLTFLASDDLCDFFEVVPSVIESEVTVFLLSRPGVVFLTANVPPELFDDPVDAAVFTALCAT